MEKKRRHHGTRNKKARSETVQTVNKNRLEVRLSRVQPPVTAVLTPRQLFRSRLRARCM
jgi:hypothetical protein